MNRGDAYRILADELQSLSLQGYDSLLSKIGQNIKRLARIGQEDVTIETTVDWDDIQKGTIRVYAAALGPSSFRMERIEESIVIRPRSGDVNR